MEMMNKTENTCTFGGDMLAYLFDEVSSDGRDHFESHLAGCSLCIDEFAELSEARYSVYEWRNVEFAPLATPRFVVPVEMTPARVSWVDSIRAAFAWNGAAALAGGLAVLVIGIIGLTMFFSSPDTSVVANVEQPLLPASSAPATVVRPTNNLETAEVRNSENERADKAAIPVRRSEQETVGVRKRTENSKARPARPAGVETVQTRRTTTNPRLNSSPTLGQYVEDRDETLRLSDLFDDIDSRELD